MIIVVAKQAKNVKKTSAKCRLFNVYKRICTDLQKNQTVHLEWKRKLTSISPKLQMSIHNPLGLQSIKCTGPSYSMLNVVEDILLND